MGLILRNTAALTALLAEASRSTSEKQQQAAALAKQEGIPWRELRPIYNALREGTAAGEGPWLHRACQGGGLLLEQPPKREKNPELLARLEVLRRQDEERRYNLMVHDVTHDERKAEAVRLGGLVEYKDQVSYGLHVIVVMGVFYLMGHYTASRLSPKPSIKVAGGLIGLMAAMLMEAVLLIIRTTEKSSRPHMQRQMLRTGPEGAPLATSDRLNATRSDKMQTAMPADSLQGHNGKHGNVKKDQ